MMVNLPNGWCVVPLDQLCDRVRGVSYKPDEASSTPKDGYLPILRANNIQNDRLIYDDLVWVLSDRVNANQSIRDGDIVVAMSSGSKSVVGKTAQALSSWNGGFGAFCGVLRPYEGLQKRYLGFFLRTHEYRHKISELSAGSNINNLKAEHFSQIEVPVAPADEQKRIVRKLDNVLNKMHACGKRLERIPAILKRFRQSVLAAACSGRLTADWREQNPSQEATAPRILRKKPLPPVGEPFLFDKPETWKWCRLGSAGEFINGDRGKNYPNKAEYVPVGIPFINTGHILPSGGLSAESMHFLTKAKFDSLRSGKIQPGDLVYCLRGATLGKTAFVAPYQEGAIASSLVIIRLNEAVDNRFVYYFLTSPFGKELVDQFDNGSAQPNLSAESVKHYTLALPPLAEQQEVVRRVESLFTLADQLEARYKKGKAYVDKLTQSILAKAFRGELVPQDPNDEPAEKLLERIRVEKNGKQQRLNF